MSASPGMGPRVDLSSGPAALGVLAIRGADAARFLQGQLSADIEELAVGSSTLAGFHNAQGRVIALLAVVRADEAEYYAVFPRELAEKVLQRLGKFVLRAKVRITDESDSLRVFGANAGPVDGIPPIAWGARQLLLVPAGDPQENHPAARLAWDSADIAGGLPQVYAATSESFVSQMLNLDLLGAIDFDKGCYTGQEVIARAHYRGRVKRRLQRWHNLSGTLLTPGQTAHAADGRPLIVVRAVRGGHSAQELLAVGTFSTSAENETDVKPVAGDSPGPRVSGPLSLPYSLPE